MVRVGARAGAWSEKKHELGHGEGGSWRMVRAGAGAWLGQELRHGQGRS